MFDSSFPHSVTSSRLVVFRIRLVEPPVRVAVIGVDSSLREFVPSYCHFDSSAGLFDSSFYESGSSPTTSFRRRSSFCGFVMAFRRFVMSTQEEL